MKTETDKFLENEVAKLVEKGCTEGLTAQDKYHLLDVISENYNLDGNEYFDRLYYIYSYIVKYIGAYDDGYIQYIRDNSRLLPFVLANNKNPYIRLYSSDSFAFSCQFHRENTPSLGITNSKNLMYCFGCGMGGNIFDYLMEYENIKFSEAIWIVAQAYNLTSIIKPAPLNEDLNKLVEKYKEATISVEYKELLEKGLNRSIRRDDARCTKIFKEDLLEREKMIEAIPPKKYPKNKVYQKRFLTVDDLKYKVYKEN